MPEQMSSDPDLISEKERLQALDVLHSFGYGYYQAQDMMTEFKPLKILAAEETYRRLEEGGKEIGDPKRYFKAILKDAPKQGTLKIYRPDSYGMPDSLLVQRDMSACRNCGEAAALMPEFRRLSAQLAVEDALGHDDRSEELRVMLNDCEGKMDALISASLGESFPRLPYDKRPKRRRGFGDLPDMHKGGLSERQFEVVRRKQLDTAKGDKT